MDEAKIARTEAAFREVNEAIARTAERFQSEDAEFVCECADPQCAHRVTADLEDYEDVRAKGTHFLLSPGHDEPRAERVVKRTPGYEVVEKLGRIGQIARRLDPRANPA